MTNDLGLYLHIPFCNKKCKYCDFYSTFVTDELLDKYCESLIESIKKWGGGFKSRPINTIYLGGGTPSLLNQRLIPLLNEVRKNFNVENACETTLEINPDTDIETLLKNAKKAGINRLSIGAQSGIDCELEVLGRTHNAEDIKNTVVKARSMGFNNISLDIMLGLPNSSLNSLKQSLNFITGLAPEHISAYILKIEEKTAFFALIDTLDLPDDDSVADQYLFMCQYLENLGYLHYEISNFSKPGFESKHNLKYWTVKEYLGLGPSAHSYLMGKRFFYPKDLKGFILGNDPVSDGLGGTIEEYIMLNLRLKSGLDLDSIEALFSYNFKPYFYEKLLLFEKNGLLKLKNKTVNLSNKGMLISNSIIAEILEEI